MSKPIKKAYKFRFYPQEELKVLLAKTFGCVRFVYNQTLDFSEKHYATKSILESQGLEYNKITVGTTVNACGGKKIYLKSNDLGRNVRPKTSKLNLTKKSRAISKETGILVL